MALGADDTVQQVAIIGHQQKTGGLLVQPADGGDRRIPPFPAIGQDVIDKQTLFLVRTGHAQRLVQQDDQACNGIKRLATDGHAGRQI